MQTKLNPSIEDAGTAAPVFVDGAKVYRSALNFKTEAQERSSIKLTRRDVVVHKPIWVIKKAIEKHGENVAASWSGGRCSTVMLHMALSVDPGIKVIFVNTGVEFPETVRYVERMSKEWDLNITVMKPEKTFWEIVNEHGFPGLRKPWDAKRKRRSGDIPPCCRWLKEKPVRKYSRESGVVAFITGMRAGESRVRSLIIREKGAQFYFVKSQNVWKYHPLAFWSTRQVSDYIVENSIPMNPIYEKIDRSGCWACTSFVGWRENLKRVNPKLYEFLDRRLSKEQTLRHFYNSRIAPCGGGT
jgi:phosphoadenosine phosphosulfate reductase